MTPRFHQILRRTTCVFCLFLYEGNKYKIAFFAVKDLHPVVGGVDEYKHVSIVKVHPHPVRDYATQTVEYQTHIHRMVVEPVRWLQSRLSIASRHQFPKMGGYHIFQDAHRRAGCCPQVLLSGNFLLLPRHLLRPLPAHPL